MSLLETRTSIETAKKKINDEYCLLNHYNSFILKFINFPLIIIYFKSTGMVYKNPTSRN